MPSGIKDFTPLAVRERRKKQARTAWVVSALLVAMWLFLILLAPLARSNAWDGLATPIYTFFSYLCHQMPERSLTLGGQLFSVCSRCFGVYFGLLLGFVVYPFFRPLEQIEPLPRFWLFLSLVPVGIDWSLGILGILENTHLSRFSTGLILGAMCAVFIIPGIVELGWLISERKRKTGQPA